MPNSAAGAMSPKHSAAIQSAAMAAVKAMDLCSTEMLLSAGTDPRVIMVMDGITPLHVAIIQFMYASD